MISPEKITQVADIFIGEFINLNIKKEDGPNFLESLLGLVYASKKVLGALEMLEILSAEQVAKIESEIGGSIKGDIDAKLKALLEQIKEEVDV
jgi:hypothetical protein